MSRRFSTRYGDAVPVVRDVRVCVDQAGNARVPGKIHHFSTAGDRRIAGGDASHAVVVDNDDRVSEHAPVAIDQFTELDSLGCRNRC